MDKKEERGLFVKPKTEMARMEKGQNGIGSGFQVCIWEKFLPLIPVLAGLVLGLHGLRVGQDRYIPK